MNIVLIGSLGRMGQRLLKVNQEPTNQNNIKLLIDRKNKEEDNINKKELPQQFKSDIVIDFSLKGSIEKNISTIEKNSNSYLVCYTNISQKEIELLNKSSKNIAIMKCSNTSLGANLLIQLTKQAINITNKSYQIDIIETHHDKKIDNPSGTAKKIIQEVEKGLNKKVDIFNPASSKKTRSLDEISISVLRRGNIAGIHEVIFSNQYEEVSIKHEVREPKIFAQGALNIANWLSQQKAGIYTIEDYLNS